MGFRRHRTIAHRLGTRAVTTAAAIVSRPARCLESAASGLPPVPIGTTGEPGEQQGKGGKANGHHGGQPAARESKVSGWRLAELEFEQKKRQLLELVRGSRPLLPLPGPNSWRHSQARNNFLNLLNQVISIFVPHAHNKFRLIRNSKTKHPIEIFRILF